MAPGASLLHPTASDAGSVGYGSRPGGRG